MQQKATYWFLVLFVGFIIFQDAGSAGTTANQFFGWLFDSVSVAGDFLGGVFGDDEGGDPAPEASPTPFPTSSITPSPDPFAEDPFVEDSPSASPTATVTPTPAPTS